MHGAASFAVLLCVAMSVVTSLPPQALAQESEPSGAIDEARARFDSGAQAFSEGRYKDAIDFFLDANRIAPNPAFSYNIGLAYEQLGDASDALRYYRDYLRRLPDAADRAEVEGRVATAEARLRERNVQQVTVLSVPEGATVSIDGRPVGVTPWTGELGPGTHATRIEMRGYRDASRSFTLSIEHSMDVSVELAPQPIAATTSAATPVTADAGAEAEEKRPGPRVAPLTWVVLGVGVAGLGTAGGLELARSGAEDDAKNARTSFDAKDNWDRAKSLETAARVAVGIGAAVTIVGGVLLYIDLTHEKSSSASVRAAAGCRNGDCGLLFDGAF